jgi:hypothetical protein
LRKIKQGEDVYWQIVACCVFFFSFTFFILTKLGNYKLASCAAIFLFIYVRSRLGEQEFFSCCLVSQEIPDLLNQLLS